MLNEIVFSLRFFDSKRRTISIEDIKEDPIEHFDWNQDANRNLKRRLIMNTLNNSISMSCMIINSIESFSIVKCPIEVKLINEYEVHVTYLYQLI